MLVLSAGALAVWSAFTAWAAPGCVCAYGRRRFALGGWRYSLAFFAALGHFAQRRLGFLGGSPVRAVRHCLRSDSVVFRSLVTRVSRVEACVCGSG